MLPPIGQPPPSLIPPPHTRVKGGEGEGVCSLYNKPLPHKRINKDGGEGVVSFDSALYITTNHLFLKYSQFK